MNMEPAETNHQHNNMNINYDDQSDIISWFEVVSENAGLVQTQTLRRILELNQGIEYLQKWLGDIKIQEVEDSALESLYTSLVPLSTHADYEPFIQRIADGDTGPILTQQPITAFSVSSGTTEGRHKYIPFTQHYVQTVLQIPRLSAAYRLRAYPTKEGGRFLAFMYFTIQRFETKGGLKVGSVTTNLLMSPEFKTWQEKTKQFPCSPQEVVSSADYKQATYCHLLLGLFFSDQVEFITSLFSHVIVRAFDAFEEMWKDLCSDIREGTLSTTRITCPKLREAVLDIISPNQSLASRFEEKCKELEKLDWSGLVPAFWPNAKYISCITTGAMQPYLKKLRHYAMDLPIVGNDYASSESYIGVNVDPCSPPECVTYAVVPTVSYFEFIPLHKEKQNCISMTDEFIEDEPIPLSQVKVGQEYEIVLTTFAGLYRYRLGDVVEVVGFHNATPKLNFICRKKLLLSVVTDKTTEKDLQIVVERGSNLLTSKAKAELVDFTSHAEMENQPGHYVIYWEIKGEVDERVLQDCCTEMDSSFIQVSYVSHRRRNFIGPLELRIVETGTFKKILDYFIGNGGTIGQFKTPRCTKNQGILGILNAGTIKRFRSTAYEE